MNSTRKVGVRGFAIFAATLGLIATAAYGAPVKLTSGIPVTEISGAMGSEVFYTIEVPASQDQLEIRTSGGTGDVDLYVRRGSEPTINGYDYRPFKAGNDETVTVEKPTAGTWYVMLKGFNAYSGVTLQATCAGQVAIEELTDGVPADRLSGAANSEQFFKMEVPADQSLLEIQLSGGLGDADLYVRQGDMPTATQYDYRPYLLGNEETVSVKNPAAGTWYIMIKARKGYEGVSLVANLSGGVPALTNDVPVANLAGQQGSETIYCIEVPAGQTGLEIQLSGGTGDVDLYVKLGARPTTTEYDYRPFVVGNNESVAVNNPVAGTWYIMLRGYNDYAGVTLKAAYGEVITLKNGSPAANLSGASGSEKFYKIEVPAGQAQLLFQMSGGAGNADMYIRCNSRPTTTTWDYRPIQSGNNESISIGNPPAGTWYIMLKGTTAYSGVTLQVDYRLTSEAITMKNNEPATNISGVAAAEQFYKIVVPEGQDMLTIQMSGGTGDADLYVKFGAMPKTSSYDYRPYLIGNEETVEVRSPKAGTWYVMIRGYQAFSGITLVARYSATVTDDAIVLQRGVVVTGIGGAINSEKFYKIDVPADQAMLEIVLSGGTGDADLYVRRDVRPTTKEWDYRPYTIGNNEKVTVSKPQAGTWYIMLRGQSVYASVMLKATYFSAAEVVTDLVNGTPIQDLSGAAGSQTFFKIVVPAGQASLEFSIFGGTGDADLYIRKGDKPTLTSYDYRPGLKGNDETVEIANPAAATWYVMLLGQQAYSGVTLKAEHVSLQDKVTVLVTGASVKGLSGTPDVDRFFSIDVPAGQNLLTIAIADGMGNADLYVRKGAKPTTTAYDYRPYLKGNEETVEITDPQAATWFIMLRAQQAYAQVTLTATYSLQSRVNDFASDPNCVALWQFEDKGLVDDAIGSNALENHGVVAETTDVKEGAGCADFRAVQADWMTVDDGRLSADFPTRSGGKSVDLSVCFWMKPRSFPYGSTLVSKYLSTPGDRSWRLFLGGLGNNGYLRLALGIGNGNNAKTYDLNASEQRFPKDRWYHVAFTYRDGDKSFHIRVWDDTAGALVYDYVGKAAGRAITDAPLILGGQPMTSEFYDGLLDEVAVFKDVLTTEEIDQIREGTYSVGK
ncbi:MAG: pre-peptidase C-terminal domain-containing protein [Solirubrobacterales bacterium]